MPGSTRLGGLRTVAVSVDEIAKNVEFVFTPLLTNQGFIDLVRDLAFLDPVSSYSALLRKGQLEEILGKAYLSNNYVQSLTYLDVAHHVAIVARADLQKARDVDVGATGWYQNYQKVENRSWWTVNTGIDGRRKGAQHLPTGPGQRRRMEDEGGPFHQRRHGRGGCDLHENNAGADRPSFVLDSLGNVAASVGATSAAEIGKITAAFASAPAGKDYLTVALESGPSLVARHVSPQSGLSYVTVLPVREVNTFVPIVVTSIAYTYLGLMIVVAAMALITYLSYYRPLNTLFLGMKSLAAGDFTVSLDSTRRDEVGYIYEGFNRTVRDLKRLIDDNYLIQLGQKDARSRWCFPS